MDIELLIKENIGGLSNLALALSPLVAAIITAIASKKSKTEKMLTEIQNKLGRPEQPSIDQLIGIPFTSDRNASNEKALSLTKQHKQIEGVMKTDIHEPLTDIGNYLADYSNRTKFLNNSQDSKKKSMLSSVHHVKTHWLYLYHENQELSKQLEIRQHQLDEALQIIEAKKTVIGDLMRTIKTNQSHMEEYDDGLEL